MPIDPHTERFPIIGWVAHFQFVPPDARPRLLRPISRSFPTEADGRAWLAEVRLCAPTVEIIACVCPVYAEVPRA